MINEEDKLIIMACGASITVGALEMAAAQDGELHVLKWNELQLKKKEHRKQ